MTKNTATATAETGIEKLNRLREEHSALVMYHNSPANKNKIAELKADIDSLDALVSQKQLEDEQAEQRRALDELLQAIKSLPEEQQRHFVEKLTPVLASRKAYMDFVLIQIPKDLKALAETEKKYADAISKSDNKEAPAELKMELLKARAQIRGHPKDGWVRDGHVFMKEKLSTAFTKAKAGFAAHY